jgi:NADH-quinone oxidoreductase subunit M
VTDFPWLTVLGAVPLVGAVVVALLPRGRDLLAKQVALAVSVVALLITVVIALRFDAGVTGFQFAQTHEWIPQFGISYAVGIDGIALVLIALTAVLTPICILAAWHDADAGARSVKAYFALILTLETMCIGVFAATDVFLFYFFFEAMLVPMYFIIGSYGGASLAASGSQVCTGHIGALIAKAAKKPRNSHRWVPASIGRPTRLSKRNACSPPGEMT